VRSEWNEIVAGRRHPRGPAAFRIVVADDHRLLLEAVKGILEPVDDLELAGVTTDACDLVGLLRELQPDLLVLDYSMPGIDGWTLLKRVRRVQSGLPVVILTGSDDPRLAQEALAHGARAFVHKSADPEDMLAAFRAALADGEPAVVEQGQSLQQVGARFGLTAREEDVLAALSRGLSLAEIGAELQISRQTVKSHVHNLYLKLDVHNRLEAVRIILEGTLFGNPYNLL
jgi:DNA-binding NarL/FixJ family response regulator